jgi:HD superfamily phosphodiesterase
LTEFQKLKKLIFGKLEKELPMHFSYHNIDHTIDVMQAAESIAGKEGINGNDKRLLLTAALFHDTGFLNSREEHETISCYIARQYLPDYNYQPAEIDLICGIIMATRIPQSPQNRLGEILADADLDYLGRDNFFILSHRLFTELQAEGIIKDEEEWNKEQADFIGDHKYFTETSIKLRQAKRDQHITVIKSKI